ncbi:MAG: 23S rRNA (adenine(2503)-C(2))-methyltransferase RlmN, partial [Candidatus Eremiobacteraeota bacterium]|nr:23S rRNA (adenine(2503)-C(2))-methyltransferase RlmN [Candidatus Eremiobacteraeota bacterium]
GAREFSAMRNIARPLLETLAERCTLARPEIVAEQLSCDGTRKWLLRMPPAHAFDRGAEIECVYIPESDRGTLCVSSQVGCTLNCSFCHTGTMPLVRNLTAQEIVGQVLVARDRLGDFPGGAPPPDGLAPSREGVRAVSNVVFMGMGEPLYNFEAVRDAIAVMTDGDGLSLSRRRITVSTSGVVPEMARLGAECGTMLAVSLHAANNPLRDKLVPLNRTHPLGDLVTAGREYARTTGRRLSFEWCLIGGVNDTVDQAARLRRLADATGAHVNVIPMNRIEGSEWGPPPAEVSRAFLAALRGVRVTVRDTRGNEADAACGQLRALLETRREMRADGTLGPPRAPAPTG